MLHHIRSLWRNLVHRDRVEHDLDDELGACSISSSPNGSRRVTPYDPAALACATALLLAMAFAAAYLPARRASRIDPLTALRHD